jgi:hypothetical protein
MPTVVFTHHRTKENSKHIYIYVEKNLLKQSHPSNQLGVRVARWYIFKPKIQIWVNFGGP